MTRRQIQRLIIQKGLTQTQLSKIAGIPYPQILCSMLRGDRWANAYRYKVAEVLGISEEELPRP